MPNAVTLFFDENASFFVFPFNLELNFFIGAFSFVFDVELGSCRDVDPFSGNLYFKFVRTILQNMHEN
ncbi:uncharacterized protein Dvar_83240 [Desulfosarcina variabilis str. Montpellier]